MRTSEEQLAHQVSHTVLNCTGVLFTLHDVLYRVEMKNPWSCDMWPTTLRHTSDTQFVDCIHEIPQTFGDVI